MTHFNSLANKLATVAPVLHLVPQPGQDLTYEVRRSGYREHNIADGSGARRIVSSLFLDQNVRPEVKARAIELFETSTLEVCVLSIVSSDGNVTHRVRANGAIWIGFLAVGLRKAEAKARKIWLEGDQNSFKWLSTSGRIEYLPQWYLTGVEVRAGSSNDKQSILTHVEILAALRRSVEVFVPKGASASAMIPDPSVKAESESTADTGIVAEILAVPTVIETGEELEMRFAWRETKKVDPATGEIKTRRYMQASRIDNMHGVVVYQVQEEDSPFPGSGETWQFTVGPVQYYRPAKGKKVGLTTYRADLIRIVPYVPKGKTAEDFDPNSHEMLVGLPGGNGDGQPSKGRLPRELRRAAAETRKHAPKPPKSDKKDKGGKNKGKKK
ncbi:MAG: hypothetical protein AAB590_01865 [Patescibacteria group bacterium]